VARSQDEFRGQVADIFARDFARLRRLLLRDSGDPELADDIAQESFIKLYQRGRLPDAPLAWLWAVSMNALRNAKSMQARRKRLLSLARAERSQADRPASPDATIAHNDQRAAVRAALNHLPPRERALLLLRAEGYSYREIAQLLELNETSVGTLLARAKRAFLDVFDERTTTHAP
jgi:RNA polymerase sigma-70 factor (ECF subfamily)